jgi:hypothetical protein
MIRWRSTKSAHEAGKMGQPTKRTPQASTGRWSVWWTYRSPLACKDPIGSKFTWRSTLVRLMFNLSSTSWSLLFSLHTHGSGQDQLIMTMLTQLIDGVQWSGCPIAIGKGTFSRRETRGIQWRRQRGDEMPLARTVVLLVLYRWM